MRKRDLDAILRRHARWLRDEPRGKRADLSRANISRASLTEVRNLAPPMVLLAYWGDVSDALCLDLMRYDCANCPDGAARFARWAADGSCPYGWSDEAPEKVARSANFQERRNLWSPGPTPSALDLMRRLLAEKCPPWTAEQRSAAEAKHAEKKVEAPHA